MAQDEGAAQTALIMQAVKRRRLQKEWSAGRLAEEMTKAGVSWDRSVVANLENGRRKSLRVHELLTLAYVLDVDTPLDLLIPLAPAEESNARYPVTPDLEVHTNIVRMWCHPGSAFTLRRWMRMTPEERLDQEMHRRALAARELKNAGGALGDLSMVLHEQAEAIRRTRESGDIPQNAEALLDELSDDEGKKGD